MTTAPNDPDDFTDVAPDYPLNPVDSDSPDLTVIPDAEGQPHVAKGVVL